MPRTETLTAYLYVLFSSLLALTCEKSPTGPDSFKDPRTYTWTIDTLAYPETFQRIMQSVWASSVNDVYVAGYTDGARGKMYHYDGKSWMPVKLHVLEGGPFSNIRSFGELFGFSSGDNYTAGSKVGPASSFEDSSLIIHFDGVRWTEQEATGGTYLQALCGISPTDLWAGGTQGSLFHYDGSTWKKIHCPIAFGLQTSLVSFLMMCLR